MRYRALIVAFLSLCLTFLTACGGDAELTSSQQLTYDDIVNTGLANSCPELDETARGFIPLDKAESYVLTDLCLQPTTFFVKEESLNKRTEAKFIEGKSLTRYTSSLTQIQGPLVFGDEGQLIFKERDGIDFQPITVLLPGGEEIPFLFTTKKLVASTQAGLDRITTSTDFEGTYRIPSYRTSNFLDPKGRGLTTGYDNAVALPATGASDKYVGENVKKFVVGDGEMSLQVTKIDASTGEIAGNFQAIQPSDTDMGGKEPVDVKLQGKFYGRIETAA